jgi:6-phosphogluconolactonase (cycloisomerase 2 family)
MLYATPIIPALRRPPKTLARRSLGAGLLALLAAAVALLGPGGAAALTVYGAPRAIDGAGGCLRDPLHEPFTDQPCPGAAVGLAGAQAVAVSPDGSSVYVAGEGAVVALTRDRATGALQPALSPSARACIAASASSPCATKDGALSGADALAVSPDGRFLYVGASNTASVSAFVRGRDGALVPLAQSVSGGYFGCVAGVALAGTQPPRCAAHLHALNGVAALAISPDGRDLYAVSYGLEPGEDSVVTLQRNPRSGGLRPLPGTRGCVQSLPGSGCPGLAGLEGASAITISQDGRFVYVASELSGAVRGFRRNPSTGDLTPLYGRGGCISSGNGAGGGVRCAVTVPQLAGARSIALSPDGRELYVAAFDPGAVVVLRRDPASGMFAPLPPNCLQAESDASCPVGLPFLRGAAALAVGPDGDVVYVIGEGANSLVELLRSPTDGALTPASESPTAMEPLSGPVALALSPGGQSIYVASPFDDGVAGLTG